MSTTMTDLAELELICGKVTEHSENGVRILYLPRVTLPAGSNPAVTEGLLYLGNHSGYATRLLLAHRTQKETNWTAIRMLDRQWFTWSWKDVSASQRPAQILAAHLRGLRL